MPAVSRPVRSPEVMKGTEVAVQHIAAKPSVCATPSLMRQGWVACRHRAKSEPCPQRLEIYMGSTCKTEPYAHVQEGNQLSLSLRKGKGLGEWSRALG